MICLKCGEEVTEGNLFCGKCGERQDGKKICPKCGSLIPAESSFCCSCGKRLVKRNYNLGESGKKSFIYNVIALIISIAVLISSFCPIQIVNVSEYLGNSMNLDSILEEDLYIDITLTDFIEACFVPQNYTTQDFAADYLKELEENGISIIGSQLTERDINKIIGVLKNMNYLKLAMIDEVRHKSPITSSLIYVFAFTGLAMMVLCVLSLTAGIAGIISKKKYAFSKAAFVALFAVSLGFTLIYFSSELSTIGAGLICFMVFSLLGIASFSVYNYILRDRAPAKRAIAKRLSLCAGIIAVLFMAFCSCMFFNTEITVNENQRTYGAGKGYSDFMYVLDTYANPDYNINTLETLLTPLKTSLESSSADKSLILKAFNFIETTQNGDMLAYYPALSIILCISPFILYAVLGILMAMLVKYLTELQEMKFRERRHLCLNIISVLLQALNIGILIELTILFNISVNFQKITWYTLTLGVLPFISIALSAALLVFCLMFKDKKKEKLLKTTANTFQNALPETLPQIKPNDNI